MSTMTSSKYSPRKASEQASKRTTNNIVIENSSARDSFVSSSIGSCSLYLSSKKNNNKYPSKLPTKIPLKLAIKNKFAPTSRPRKKPILYTSHVTKLEQFRKCLVQVA